MPNLVHTPQRDKKLGGNTFYLHKNNTFYASFFFCFHEYESIIFPHNFSNRSITVNEILLNYCRITDYNLLFDLGETLKRDSLKNTKNGVVRFYRAAADIYCSTLISA